MNLVEMNLCQFFEMTTHRNQFEKNNEWNDVITKSHF